jgi:hypothetical protein
MEEKKNSKIDESVEKWLGGLYDIKLISKDELISGYDQIKYDGFNREEVIKSLITKFKNDFKSLVWIIITVAVRGPQAANMILLPNGKRVDSYRIPVSGLKGKKSNILSLSRISASTADLAAFYLKQMEVNKRLPKLDCPAWLQFPTAGSIKLPDDLRKQHEEFSREFSKMLPGGSFKEDIYNSMITNSYYNKNLNLF